ncbi:MAG: prolipoprotein diacylglyceryl transferase [Ruminococcaceae bacterium]|nr:prolipoprotein diacylglyceryl transferase [Oscillospiraceae bacterium]
MNRIAFPGLGLEFNINPTAFTVFGIEIQWYGIILSLGICAAFLLFYANATKKENIDSDSVLNITLMVVPISIIGARFFYVVTEWDHYKNKSFLDIINIRAGGIAIYGAIIFGLITVLIYNWVKKTNPLNMMDAMAPALMVGQTIGRWGNFVNAEAYGWTENIDNLPWRMEIDNVVRKMFIDGERVSRSFGPGCVHPTFLYESLWNFLGLAIILLVLYRKGKKKFDGEIACAYLIWYGLGRAIIETVRTDSLYIVGTLKFSVFVGIVSAISGVILALILYFRNKSLKNELSDYKPAFESVKISVAEDNEDLEAEDENQSLDNIEEDAEILAQQDLLDGDASDIEE